MERLVQLNRIVDEIFADTQAFASIEEASEVAGLVDVLQHRLDALAARRMTIESAARAADPAWFG